MHIARLNALRDRMNLEGNAGEQDRTQSSRRQANSWTTSRWSASGPSLRADRRSARIALPL